MASVGRVVLLLLDWHELRLCIILLLFLFFVNRLRIHFWSQLILWNSELYAIFGWIVINALYQLRIDWKLPPIQCEAGWGIRDRTGLRRNGFEVCVVVSRNHKVRACGLIGQNYLAHSCRYVVFLVIVSFLVTISKYVFKVCLSWLLFVLQY